MSNNYTQQPLYAKLKKTIRYVKIYGLMRTLIKIKGQYHIISNQGFNGSRWVNPKCKEASASNRFVAIVGCGNFAYSNIAYYLSKANKNFLLYAYDVEKSRARSLCESYRGAYAICDWREILKDPQVKIVFIASNHASHADYAVEFIKAGKHVHIEKPHVVSDEQLDRLITAMKLNPKSKVFLGFNRPRSSHFEVLSSYAAREVGPLMINWFIAGHEISENHWYFNNKEGGRVLGNLCHWTDLTLRLVTIQKAFPCTIVSATPVGAKSDFVVSVMFADRSCAAITFSAKGHTFEGVREVLNLHRGNLLANLSDFHILTLDIFDKKIRRRLFYRDHGHSCNIVNSYIGADNDTVVGEDLEYVSATAKLFLAIRHSIETGNVVEVQLNTSKTSEGA
jgi:predicted dehydrogenase